MRDNFASNGIPSNGAEAAAIEAVRTGPLDVSLGSIGVERSDAFDECSVKLVVEDDCVPGFESIQEESGGDEQYVVPIFIIRRHRIACNFMNAKHIF